MSQMLRTCSQDGNIQKRENEKQRGSTANMFSFLLLRAFWWYAEIMLRTITTTIAVSTTITGIL